MDSKSYYLYRQKMTLFKFLAFSNNKKSSYKVRAFFIL